MAGLTWLEPDRLVEAGGDSTARRAQRANRAAQDVLRDRNAAERDAVRQLTTRLNTLQTGLKTRLLSGDGSLTDFQRFDLQARLRDVDHLIESMTTSLATDAETSYNAMADLGVSAADEPLHAAQLRIGVALPGIDARLVTTAFDNTLELLTQPMRQFGSDVKVSLRRVALAGENRFEEIQRLRDTIAGQWFDNAQYRAERIIRTELGRIFNQATYDRLVELAKEFTFLRKGWRATGDGRTRRGHVEAGRNYSRGQGVSIAGHFVINVYKEKRAKGVVVSAVLIGKATLRFPLDPAAMPAGKIAAGATILCRCNGFVDFSLSDFAEYSATQVQLALGGLKPPITPGPQPVPQPAPTPQPAPRKPRAVRQPKPAATKIPTEHPQHVLPTGPTDGPKVSASLKAPARGPLADLYRKAMGLIDKVHSDGILNSIPLKQSTARYYGQYHGSRSGDAKGISISKGALSAHPINTLIHETGHWLDNSALLRRDRGYVAYGSQANHGLVAEWQRAAKASETYQQLKRWYSSANAPAPAGLRFRGKQVGDGGVQGDGMIPKGLNYQHLRYLLSTEETFARSYAQYVVIRSGDPAALAELRMMQKAASYGDVAGSAPFNGKPMGQEPVTGSWDYPTVWQDKDFEPIAAAFDAMFEKLGWRKTP